MTPTKNDLITIIINSPTINNTLNTIHPVELRADFRQHFYLQLCEVPEQKLLSCYHNCTLESYAGAIIRNQIKSDSSSFFKLYRSNLSTPDATTHYYNLISTDESKIDEHKTIEAIHSFLRALHPKKVTLFKEHYFKGKTIPEISKKYKIAPRTVYHIIKETKDLIRQHLKEQ